MFWITILHQMCHIFPIYVLSSHSLSIIFHRAEYLILMKSSLAIISFMYHIFDVVSKKHQYNQSHVGFLLCYLLGLLEFCILCLRSAWG